MRIFKRMMGLLRGRLRQWVGTREKHNPDAVYEEAIADRLSQYERLREAAAGILYMRSKLAKELDLKSAEVRRVSSQLAVAVDGDEDDVALALIQRRDHLNSEIDRLTGELNDVSSEAEVAKKNLASFHEEITRLRDEKTRMMARLANAQARLRFQSTLSGLSPEADIQALEAVREHVHKVMTQAQMGRELGDADLEHRLNAVRDAEADAAARAQLQELKRSRRRSLVPLVMTSQPS